MKLSKPVEIEIVRRKDNGGMVIKVPISKVTPKVNGELTAGGGEDFSVTTAMFEDCVKNFKIYPGPIAVHVGHIRSDIKDTAPAFAYVIDLEIKDDLLMATLDLTPSATFEIMDAELYRGASVELEHNPILPTIAIKGWCLTGLAITNEPALDVNFKVAASKKSSINKEEKTMNLEEALKQIEALNAEILKLTASLEEIQKDQNDNSDSLRQKSREYQKLAIENDKQKERIAVLEKTNNDRMIQEIVETALELGKVTPAEVKGYSDDPTKWLSENYGPEFTPLMLEKNYAKRTAVVNTTNVKTSGLSGNLARNVSKEVSVVLENLGLDPAYALCTSTDEARRIAASKK